MSLIDIKNKWDIALDGVGYMLRGTPESPRYRMTQATLFNPRYAQGDRSYEDLSQYWFVRQTDWYSGFKTDQSWEDDGKYFYATNIDTYTNPGEIKCAKGHTDIYTFSETLTCGSDGLVSADSGKFVGTYESTGDSKPNVYKENGASYDDISPGFSSVNLACSQMYLRENTLWLGSSASSSNGATFVVAYTNNGSTFTDCTGDIRSVLYPGTIGSSDCLQKSLCQESYNGTHYVFVTTSLSSDPNQNQMWSLLKTTETSPSSSAHWTKILSGYKKEPIACKWFASNLYYLLYEEATSECQLWCYNLSAGTNQQIYSFQNANYNNNYCGDKYLHEFNGKLVVTVPDTEVWEWDGTNIQRIFLRDSNKQALGHDAEINLYYGALIVEGRLHWYNLVYDGFNFHNWIKDNFDSSNSVYLVPLFSSTDGKWYGTGTATANTGKMFSLGAASYKGTDGKNYLIMNNLDTLVGVDKVAYFVDIMFNKLSDNDKIEVSYCTDELTSSSTFISLGSVSYSTDGGNITQKRFYFPINVTYRKIWLKIDLSTSTGTTTAVVKDVVFAYLPHPDEEAIWTLTINGGDYQLDYQNEPDSKRGREIKEKIWLLLRNKQNFDYQDVNYCSTTLSQQLLTTDSTMYVADTSEFPEAGRLMIGDVVYYYTGKTINSFTGVTQGKKETSAVTQAQGATVHNGYKVRLQSVDTVMPTSYQNDTRQNEYDIQVVLREIK